MENIWSDFFLLATPAEQALVAEGLAKMEWKKHGAALVQCRDPSLVSGGSHWVSYAPRGIPGLLVQIKPPGKLSEHLSADVVRAPDLFFWASGMQTLYKVRNSGRFVASGGFPTAVLEGLVVLRRRVCDRVESYQAERERTLQILLNPQPDYEPVSADQSDLLFLAHQCLWWRLPRADEDFQMRMVTARYLLEGEPGNTPTFRPELPFLPGGGSRLKVLYRPHFTPSQVQVVQRDVPPILVGVHLDGLDFRPHNASHSSFWVPSADPDTLQECIKRLGGEK